MNEDENCMEFSKEYILLLEGKLQKELKSGRYLHTLGVAYLSASLAMCYGVSHREALIAGLLHDCAKNYSNEDLLKKCIKHEVVLTEAEKKIPAMLHSVYGAYLAREKYGIENEDIISAVRYHTVGRPAMSILEQIVFLADYLEPERTQPTNPSLDEIRKVAFQSLDEATYLVVKNTVEYLESSNSEVNPVIYEVFEYYKKKTGK